MTYFPWSDDYSVHLRIIDTDHKDLVDTVNALHDAITQGAGRKAVGRTISNLAHYVDEHFTREETLMDEYGYPDIERHKKIHRHLVRTVYAIRIIFGHEPQKIDPKRLLDFLREWLIHHILEEDMKYAPYMRGDCDTGHGTAGGHDDRSCPASFLPEPITAPNGEETLTLTVPASKAAALRRCARLLADGGLEAIAIEDIVMPVGNMTFDEALHFAAPILRHTDEAA